jgi:hypothetical protein
MSRSELQTAGLFYLFGAGGVRLLVDRTCLSKEDGNKASCKVVRVDVFSGVFGEELGVLP